MNIENLAKNYQPDQTGIDAVQKSKTAFVVGIIAAGKDTIVKRLLEMPDYHLIISHTTRKPRANNGVMEVNGVDYHFVSFEEMAQLLLDYKMVEINKFGDNYYGTSVAEIAVANANGKIATSDIDVHGIKSFSDIAPNNTTAIFIIPPDYNTWMNRLKARYDDADDILAASWQSRRDITIDELEHALASSNYHFVINDDLETAVEKVDEIAHGVIDGDYDSARAKAKEILDTIKQLA